jgi:tRNA (guanine10-N2)-dimethyltransferase
MHRRRSMRALEFPPGGGPGELHIVMKPGRCMLVVADGPVDLHAEACSFRILERHTDRVHRSLTRFIFVCRT